MSPIRGRRRAAVAALAVSVVAALTPAVGAVAAGTTAPAATGQATFGLAPATNGKLDGRPYFQYESTPNVTLHDEVAVANASTFPLYLTISAADAQNTSTGGFALQSPLVKPTDVGAWITFGSKRGFVVPKRGPKGPTAVFVPFTVHVPANASPGDHVGGIVVTLTSTAISKSGQKLHLLQRVGARVFVRVAGPLRPSLEVVGLTATYHGHFNPFTPGTLNVSFTVKNTGNAKLSGLQILTVSSLLGAKTTLTLPPLPLLLPGGSDSEAVPVTGIYQEVLLHAGVTVRLVAAPGDVDPGAAPASATVSVLAIPWAIVIAIAILILAGVGYWRWRRHRAARAAEKDKALGGEPAAGSESSDTLSTSDTPVIENPDQET